MVLGLRCDEDGQPVSMAVGPGQTPEPRPLAAQLAKVTSRFGATAITLVGDRGMLKGQHIAALGQHGGQDMPAMTTPQMANLRRTGTLHMALLAQEFAEGLTEEGLRYVPRRTPGRAQAVRDTRHAQLAALQVQVAQQNHSLTAHPRAKAQGAVQKRVAHATPLRLAAWVERTREERPIPWTVKTNAQQEAAPLEGCSGLKTALTPHTPPQRWCLTATKMWRRSRTRFAPANRAPRSAPQLLTSRSPHPGPCRGGDVGLPEPLLSGVRRERLRRHGRRRPPRPDDAVSRRSSPPECPQRARPAHTARRHRALPAQG